MREWSAWDLAREDWPAPTWLIEKLVPGTGWHLMVGPAKTGKTVLMAQMAFAMAGAGTFLEHEVGGGGPKKTAIVEGDSPIEEFAGQLRALIDELHIPKDVADRVRCYELLKPLTSADLPTATDLVTRLRAFQPDYIVYDALESITLDNINTQEARQAVLRLKMIAEGLPFAVIHHPRKRQQGQDGTEDVRDAAAGHHFLSANASLIMMLSQDGQLQYVKRRGKSATFKLKRHEIDEDAFYWERDHSPEGEDDDLPSPTGEDPNEALRRRWSFGGGT